MKHPWENSRKVPCRVCGEPMVVYSRKKKTCFSCKQEQKRKLARIHKGYLPRISLEDEGLD